MSVQLTFFLMSFLKEDYFFLGTNIPLLCIENHCIIFLNMNDAYETFSYVLGRPGMKPLPKKATRNVTMAALLIEEVTRQLARE